VLIPGFTRALKDPFAPSRIAAIMSLSATQEYYEIDDIAKRILPNLCVATVDPEKYVRFDTIPMQCR
jgi:SCY1-like protein 1